MVADRMTASIFIARSPKVAARMLGDEMMIVSAQQSELYTLNETAAAIWNAADGVTPLETIVAQHVCAAFEVGADEALRDAQALVTELAACGVLIASDTPLMEGR